MPKPLRWIVAADGRHARLYEQMRPGAKYTSAGALDMTPDEAARGKPQDRAPRVHESMGDGRHSIEARVSPHDDAELAFLHRLAEHLGAAAKAGRYEGLVLFAPPRALGVLRPALEHNAAPLEASFDLDIVQETAEQIQARLHEAGLR